MWQEKKSRYQVDVEIKKKITEVPSASGAEQIEFETSVVWTS